MRLIKYHNNPRKHKGVTLIYIMIVMMLLLAFTSAILTLMLSNIRLTSDMKNSYKVQLAAESGIQQGMEALKNKIINDPRNQNIYAEMESNQSDSTLSYDLPDTITSPNSNYTVRFNDTVDSTPNSPKLQKNSRYAIDITSTATVNGSTKTINAYIDERNIENKYFTKLFATDNTNNTNSKIQQQDANNTWPTISSANFTNAITMGHEISNSAFEVSGALGNTASRNTLVSAKYTTDLSGESPLDSINLNSVFDTFSTYIRTGQGGITFPNNEVDNETLERLLNTPGSTNSYYNAQTIEDNLNYAGVYKMIFVHGNAHITSLQHTLVNYVIYVDGTLTIDGNPPQNTVNLLNCSIYAGNFQNPNNINVVMTGMGSTNTKNLVLRNLLSDGTTLTAGEITNLENNQGLLSSIQGEKFTSAEKGAIDDQMNKNLDNYYNGLQFRILDWEEH